LAASVACLLLNLGLLRYLYAQAMTSGPAGRSAAMHPA
jgi:hypothetical protein